MAEDEITLDFSKIKDFFKGDKRNRNDSANNDDKRSLDASKVQDSGNREESRDLATVKKPEDDEISLDFSKVKAWFKSDKGSKRAGGEGDEISLDLASIKSAFTSIDKYKVLLLILIPLIISIHFRLQPVNLPITDDWARDSVNNFYKNNIRNEINQRYPTLPEANKNLQVEKQFDILLKEQGDMIEQQIEQTSLQFKQEFKDDSGQTYLLAIDPYFWLRFVENIEKNGHPGDEIRDGEPYDNHFIAPNGRPVGPGVTHSYIEYYMYKIMSVFKKDISPMAAAFYVPVILAALCVIPTFFIAKKVAGNSGGFFASIMVAIHAAFLTRTAGGFADTDAYNVLFPLLITWLFFEAFENKDKKKVVLFCSLAGLFLGVYSRIWVGWWYIFGFLVGTSVLYLAYHIIMSYLHMEKANKSRRIVINSVFLILFFIASSVIFVSWISDFHTFTKVYTAPLSFTRIKTVGAGTIWPNVYTTVAEQNEVSVSGIISNIGGRFLFYLSLVGILLTLLRKDKYGLVDVKYPILLSIWFVSTIYASTKGVRWVLLLVPAFSIALGAFIGIIAERVPKLISGGLGVDKRISQVVIIAVLALLFMAPFNRAKDVAKREIPSMNDAWVRSLDKIKTNSSENAIINSWWDFGHWFKYWADRPVTFDGTSQNTPQAHWIGRTLLTDNEEEAVALLRMVDCGGNNAWLTLDEELGDGLKAVRIVKEIIMMEKADARRLLLEEVDEETADNVLELTHCNPPEDFFIASEDMVGKSGVWAHFGSWNFTRADMVWKVKPTDIEEGKQILMERFGLDEETADIFYYQIQTEDPNHWIADWPSYASGVVGCSVNEDLVSCGNGINFNMTSEDAYVDSAQGRKYPKSCSFVDEDGEFREISYEEDLLVANDGRHLSVAIIPNGDGFQSILMVPELTSSMFTRMFYFKGHGLKYFKPFWTDRDVTGLDIYVYKVEWP
jgi:hypothetical protein